MPDTQHHVAGSAGLVASYVANAARALPQRLLANCLLLALCQHTITICCFLHCCYCCADHLNLMTANPLRGPNPPELGGPRFLDLSGQLHM